MIAVFSAIGAWFVRRFAAWGIGGIATLAFLGPVGPVVSGIANAIGALLTATFEIVASMSKSAEGRVLLGLLVAALGFLYLRFHYIEEGKSLAHASLALSQKHCPALESGRRKR
jgi:hypothetical protein